LDEIKEYSSIDASNLPSIIKIRYTDPKQKYMYQCVVYESGGGQSYRPIDYCNLGFTKRHAINVALDFFDTEHARPELSDDENCEYCTKNRESRDDIPMCKQKFISDLKNNMCAEIDYLVGPDSISVYYQI
jgi:hypothetical protein